MTVHKIELDTEEVETLIWFHEQQRDDAIDSCEDEEAERHHARIQFLWAALKQTVGN